MTKYFVYILASKKNGTLYIGITSNLKKRVWEHKKNIVPGFTMKYNVHMLVYIEEFNNSNQAIEREKNMKEWKRKWKVELIETKNPNWNDLYEEIV